MRHLRALVLAGLMLLLTPGAYGGACLILPFENQTKNAKLEWIGESFVEGLAERLASPHLHVVTRGERAAAFDMLGVPAVSILSRASIIKLADTLKADYVVIGEYSLDGDGQLRASAQVLSMDPPRLGARWEETGPLTDLLNVQNRVADSVGRGIAEHVPSGDPEPARLDAWENYIRGLMAPHRDQQIKFLQDAVRRDARLSRASLRLGKVYFESRDYAAAIPWLSKLHQGDRKYLEAQFLLGIAWFMLDDYAKAEAAFQTVSGELPLNEVYNNLAAAQSRLGKRAALDNFRLAADGDPNDPDYQFNLGYWQWKAGQYASATRRLRAALERRPNDTEARALLVNALERSGGAAEAGREREALARNAVARLQDTSDAIFKDVERLKRNYDESSFRQLQMALASLTEESLSRLSGAEHARVHQDHGRDLFRQQNDDQALRELKESLALGGPVAETHLLLARIHERHGRKEEAVREALSSLALERSVDAHLLLAKIYLEQERLREAREQAQAASQLEPGNVAAHSVLKTVQMRSQSSQ